MEEFPANTHKQKPVGPPKEEKPKQIERVTNTDAIRRKKPLGARLKEMIVGGDARSVGEYVMLDILLPAAKDTIADMVSQGVERMIFGEARSSSRRTGYRPGRSYVDYNRYSSSRDRDRDRDRWRDEPRRERMSSRARATHNFDEIILATRVEAEEVLDRLFDLVSKYDAATVADLYELVGEDRSYTDDKWGWTNIQGADIRRIRNGYLLDLPRPEPLD